MKHFKNILMIFGVLGLPDNVQASKGSMAKSAVKLASAFGTSHIMSTAYAEGRPQAFDTTTQASPSPSSSYKQYIASYEQYSQFDNSKLPAPTAAKINQNKITIIHPLDNATTAVDMSAFNTSNKPPLQQATLNQDAQSQGINSTFAPDFANLQVPKPLSSSLSQGLSGSFMPKVTEKSQPKPIAGQLLLTYDKTDTPEQSSSGADTNPNDMAADSELVETPQETNVLIEQTQTTSKPAIQQDFVVPQQQPVSANYDINQIIIDTAISQTSTIIDSWVQEYADSASNMYAQENLKNDIITTIFSPDAQGKLESINLQTEVKILERLLEKYKSNPSVQTVVGTILTKVKQEITSQAVTPVQANNAISYYYNPDSLAIMSSFLHIEPIFDANTGAVKNMPSVETIIESALENPTKQAYQALQASLEATNIAIYAARKNKDALSSQLQSFQSSLTTALKKPVFNQYQSWTTYASSFIPSTRDVLNAPGIKNITVSTAINTATDLVNATAPYARSIASGIGLTNLGETTMSQLAKKVGLTPADPIAPPVAPKPGSLQDRFNSLRSDLTTTQNALNFDMSSKDIATIVAKNSSNKVITQSYTPAMQADIFTLMKIKPQINSKTGAIENMPTVDDIIATASNNPSQEAYNALQSALEATRVALYARRSEASILGSTPNYLQLQSFEKQITTALQDQKMLPFHDWTTQATSYITSFLPSVETTLNATGLANVTINQALSTITQSPRIANQTISALGLKPLADSASLLAETAVNASGVPNMTLAQAYDRLYPQTNT